jgi:8-oxo-dGTP diphosphatase
MNTDVESLTAACAEEHNAKVSACKTAAPQVKRYVAGFAFDTVLKHVLLIQKTKPAWQAGKLNGIGGKVESHEHDSIDAMVREFYEEANIYTTRSDWRHYAALTIRADAKVGSQEPAHVDFFCSKMPGAQLHSFTSMTEECVTLLGVDQCVEGNVALLPNLCWLVPMAKRHLQGHVPRFAHIIEN